MISGNRIERTSAAFRRPDFTFVPRSCPRQKSGLLSEKETAYREWLAKGMNTAWKKSEVQMPDFRHSAFVELAASSLVRSNPARLERLVAWGMLCEQDASAIENRSTDISVERLSLMLMWHIAEHLALGQTPQLKLKTLVKQFIPHNYLEYLIGRYGEQGISPSHAWIFAISYPANPEGALVKALEKAKGLVERFKSDGVSFSDALFFSRSYSDSHGALARALKQARQLAEKYQAQGVTLADAWHFVKEYTGAERALVQRLKEAKCLAEKFGAQNVSFADAWYFTKKYSNPEGALVKALERSKELADKYKARGVSLADAWLFVKGFADPDGAIAQALDKAEKLVRKYKTRGVNLSIAWYFVKDQADPEAALVKALREAESLTEKYKSRGVTLADAWLFARAYAHPENALVVAIEKAEGLVEKLKETGISFELAFYFTKAYKNPERALADALEKAGTLADKYGPQGISFADAMYFIKSYADPEEALLKARQKAGDLAENYSKQGVSFSHAWLCVTKFTEPKQILGKAIQTARQLENEFKASGVSLAEALRFAILYTKPRQSLAKAIRDADSLSRKTGVSFAVAWVFVKTRGKEAEAALLNAQKMARELVVKYKDVGISYSKAFYIAKCFPSDPQGKVEEIVSTRDELKSEFGKQGISDGWAYYFAVAYAKPRESLIAALAVRDRLAGKFGVSGPVALYFVARYSDPEQALARLKNLTQEIAEEKHIPSKEMWDRVAANLGLIRFWANKYLRRGLDFEDLCQEGTIGMLSAIRLFDPDRGAKFSTYASIWVRQAMGRAIKNTSKTVRRPAHIWEAETKMEKAKKVLLEELGREPTEEEIAALMEISEDKVEKIIRAQGLGSIRSLDAKIGGDDERTLGELIADTSQPDSEEIVLEQDLKEQLEEALGSLKPRTAFVIRKRFLESMTLEDVALLFDPPVTRERVRQLEKDALRILRNKYPRLKELINEE